MFPQLFECLAKNDTENIQKIIIQSLANEITDQRDILNECRDNGLSLAHFACKNSNLNTIKILHNYKLNFQSLDPQNQTPLFFAVKRKDLEIIQFLVQQVKVNINHKQYQNRTPMYLAAFQGNLKIVDYLYSKGADPQMESKLSRTPLSKACYLGNVSVAQYLIKIGVNITAPDSKGRTALHNAAWGIQGGRNGKRRGNIHLQDSPQCVNLLLNAGHKIDYQDFDGFTPLFSAVSSLAIKSMRILIERGANLNHKTKKNQTVVFVAAKYGHLQVLKLLIQQYKCQYEQENIDEYSPLVASMTINQINSFKYLLDLYMKQNKLLEFQKFWKCLTFFGKQANFHYFNDWVGQNQHKKKYFYQNFLDKTNNNFLLDKILLTNQKSIQNYFNFLASFIDCLQKNQIQTILNIAIMAYNQDKFHKFPTFIWSIKKYIQKFQIFLKDLRLGHQIQEDETIKLLSLDSNISANIENFHKTLLYIVNRRLTKVILWILSINKNEKTINTGIYRFSQEQINQVFRRQTQQHTSVIKYCFIHGIHDSLKILQNQKTQANIYIPQYQYSYEIIQGDSKACLEPVKKQYFDFNYLKNSFLTENEYQLYNQFLQLYNYKPSYEQMKIDYVDNQKIFQQMQQFFIDCNLIGIDIEHYSNSKGESFICLVQIAGKKQTFLIDPFKIQKQVISTFLKIILQNQNKIKIFHSYDNDLKWIYEDFQVVNLRSVVDTSKLFSILNPKINSPSLKLLAENILSYQMSKDFQRSDWRIRPLFKQMKTYAGLDALLLPFIYLKMLFQSGIQSNNKEDQNIFQNIKKIFGHKRLVKSKNRRNILKFK